ncbi:hypothetical protein LP419_27040 [Massilia sp. H-1]|nr:hypothetical protein LP419_27040 [Massilia sp. H-1]
MAALQRIAANNRVPTSGATISDVGRGVGRNQAMDRIAGEIQGAVNQANRVLATGGTGRTVWGNIHQRITGTGNPREALALGNAVQQVAESRLLENVYLREANVFFNRGHTLDVRNAVKQFASSGLPSAASSWQSRDF